MNEFIFGPRTLLRLHQGPLSYIIDRYLQLLREQGYAQQSAEIQIRLVAGFSMWLRKNGCGAQDVSAEMVDRYLKYRYRHLRPRKDDAAALHRLLDLLCRMTIISPQTTPMIMSPCDRLLDEFRLYLSQERALSMGTIPHHLHFTREFLCECFIGDTIDFSQLRARDVTGYVMRYTQTLGRNQTQKMTIALRSFLRFLRYRGDVATDLAASVPSVACWSLSEVPKYLEPSQVQSILDHCDRKTATGLRDYAILLLLARLGLRAGEVAFLMLEDMDWEAGQITVHGKGGRSALFPLPVDVGKAVSAYLKNGRPTCSSRSVFVTGRAPRLGLPGPGNISSIARRALARAGIDSHHKGAHRLRHSLATQMLRQGASLAEIGEVLRHRNPNTTAIYAKVDLTALRTLALPWPGGVL